MKLDLVFAVLLLAPLVVAELVPNGPRVLYDNDYVLIDGLGPYRTTYNHTGTELTFQFLRNPSTHRDPSDWMTLRGVILGRQKLSFAIDTYLNDLDDKNLCGVKSSAELRKLISSCSRGTVIRELTDEEKQKLKQFKSEYAESKNPLKVVYHGKEQRFQTQTVGQTQFMTDFHLEDGGDVVLQVLAIDRLDTLRYMELKNRAEKNQTENSSFTVEGIQRSANCYETHSEHLLPIYCTGKIWARSIRSV